MGDGPPRANAQYPLSRSSICLAFHVAIVIFISTIHVKPALVSAEPGRCCCSPQPSLFSVQARPANGRALQEAATRQAGHWSRPGASAVRHVSGGEHGIPHTVEWTVGDLPHAAPHYLYSRPFVVGGVAWTLYVTSTPQYEHPRGWHVYLHPVFLPRWHAHDHVAVSLHVSLPAEAHDGTPHVVEDLEHTFQRLGVWDGSESDGRARSTPKSDGVGYQGDEDPAGQPAQEAVETAEEDEDEEAVDLAFMHVAFLPGAIDHWYGITEGYGGQYGGDSEVEGVYDTGSGDEVSVDDDGECDYEGGGGWWGYSPHEDTSSGVDVEAQGPCRGQGGEGEGQQQQQQQGQVREQQRGGYGGPPPRSLVVRISFASVNGTWEPTANHLEAQYDRLCREQLNLHLAAWRLGLGRWFESNVLHGVQRRWPYGNTQAPLGELYNVYGKMASREERWHGEDGDGSGGDKAELWAVAPEALECCEDPDGTCRDEEGMKERDALEWYNGQWEEAPGWAARRAALQRLQNLVWGALAAETGSQEPGSQSGQERAGAQRREDPGREGREGGHVEDVQLPNDGEREWQLRAALRLADALGVGQRFRRVVRMQEAAAPGAGAAHEAWTAPDVGAATGLGPATGAGPAPASGLGQSPLQGDQVHGGGLGTQGQAQRSGLSGQGEEQHGLEFKLEYGGEVYSWDQPLRMYDELVYDNLLCHTGSWRLAEAKIAAVYDMLTQLWVREHGQQRHRPQQRHSEPILVHSSAADAPQTAAMPCEDSVDRPHGGVRPGAVAIAVHTWPPPAAWDVESKASRGQEQRSGVARQQQETVGQAGGIMGSGAWGGRGRGLGRMTGVDRFVDVHGYELTPFLEECVKDLEDAEEERWAAE